MKKLVLKSSLSEPWRIFAFESAIFFLSLTLGILGGIRLNKFFKIRDISPAPVSIGEFLIYFLIGTGLILLFVYFFKHRKTKAVLFRTLFLFVVGVGNLYFFDLWIPSLYALLLTIVLVFFLARKPSLLIHNLTAVFAFAGVGSGLGLSFDPSVVILLLLIFSVYDFIAVYKTGHMVKMAKEMLRSRALLGIVVPRKISDLRAEIKMVKPGGRFLVLGGGDIIFPLIFAVSLIPQGVFNAVVVAFFSWFGLLAGFLYFVFQKKIRRPMPALPPIALFSIIGYLVTFLF